MLKKQQTKSFALECIRYKKRNINYGFFVSFEKTYVEKFIVKQWKVKSDMISDIYMKYCSVSTADK